jgi:hypothetical protein
MTAIWVGEAREPDHSWTVLIIGDDVKAVARVVRQWKRDRGHLADETRVRQARPGEVLHR